MGPSNLFSSKDSVVVWEQLLEFWCSSVQEVGSFSVARHQSLGVQDLRHAHHRVFLQGQRQSQRRGVDCDSGGSWWDLLLRAVHQGLYLEALLFGRKLRFPLPGRRQRWEDLSFLLHRGPGDAPGRTLGSAGVLFCFLRLLGFLILQHCAYYLKIFRFYCSEDMESLLLASSMYRLNLTQSGIRKATMIANYASLKIVYIPCL